MYGMSRRIILRDDRSLGGDGNMCSRVVFKYFCDDLLELSRWDLLGLSFFLELLKLFDRNVCGNYWLNCLHGMPRRIVLRDDRSLGSDGNLRSRKIFDRFSNCLY